MKKLPPKTRFPRPVPVLLRPWEELLIVVVGVGGNGSWLVDHIARLLRVLKDQGKKARAILIDPDIIEAKNIYRQNFCDAELSTETPFFKASSLSFRLALALGVEVSAICQEFDPNMLDGYLPWIYRSDHVDRLTIVVSCVDNAKARNAVFKVLEANKMNEAPKFWVLDCGNFPATEGDECGQVYLGSAASASALHNAFSISKHCIALPSPALQAPDLLIPRQEELEHTSLSCADITAANEQGLMINPMVATVVAQYLFALVLNQGKGLRTMSTSVNLTSLKMDSDYITPESVAKIVGQDPTTLFAKKR